LTGGEQHCTVLFNYNYQAEKEVYEARMKTMRIADNPSPSNGRRVPLKPLAAVFFLALSGLFLLAACGGDNEESTPAAQQTQAPAGTQAPAATSQPAAGELDPCALLAKADAEGILGTSLGEPERQTVGPFEGCVYSDEAGAYLQLQVSSDVYTQSTFDEAMKAAADQLDVEAEPVPGLGDSAYWLGGVLWVQKGDVSLNLLAQTPELTQLRLQGDTQAEQQSLALATDLARKALEGLR
jgi:hypothetical protein